MKSQSNFISFTLKMLVLLASFSAIIACDAPAKGDMYLVNIDDKGVILDGYDPVAFFTQKMPVKGNAQMQTKWHDAIYYFSSNENKMLFDSMPEKYAPQFGGYCGYAVSLGHLAPVDVNFFSIINDRLILQHNAKATDGWNKNPNSLELADKYWPQLLSKRGKPIIPDEEKKFLVNVNDDGYVAEGYDVVSYFTDSKPVKGDPKIVKLYNGGFYVFASEEHKQLFGADPSKYAPQYGGYCAYAISRNKLRPIDPEIYQIVEGRLMLQHSKSALESFSEDIPGNTAKADGFWPGLVSERAGKQTGYDEMVQK
ncbi:MAG: YHS domain-containing (seleno)protein [Saprospiraceae bacterium]